MRNKNGIIILTIIVALLCAYNLSFTWIARGIEEEAAEFATDANGKINFSKRQAYLDSIWSKEVFAGYTYQQVKEKELKLGLDLQGGMHVVLEVSPVDIVNALSGNSKDPKFVAAIKAASVQKGDNAKFVEKFAAEFKKADPDGKLSRIFATSANKSKISFESSDDEVIKFLNAEVEESIDRAFEIIRTRIDKFGVTQPNIQRLPGSGRIQVELPGSSDPERVRKLLSGVAKLEFFEVWEADEFGPYLEKLNNYLVKNAETPEVQALSKKKKENTSTNAPLNNDLSATTLAPSADSNSLAADNTLAVADSTAPAPQKDTTSLAAAGSDTAATDTARSSLLAELFVPIQGGLAANVLDTARVNQLFKISAVKAIFPINVDFLWDKNAIVGQDGSQFVALYPIKKGRDGKALLDGSVITDARQDFGEGGRAEVTMQMNATGARIWRKMTSDNIGRRIAIALDNYVYSAPTVQGEIPNGQSSISGSFSIEEAKDLANVLKAGKLPAPTRIVEEAIVGPSLGKESIHQGFTSTVIGVVLVVLVMILYYNKGGLFADLALLINVFFIIGILAQFGSALTLPGIAGIVLTLGMAVDANVLIFERIKEEMNNGAASFSQAVASGFGKAYSSIIDGNVTTALTAIILFIFGTGGVKGFALTLLIGLACSLFTAVFITRLMIEIFGVQKGKAINFESSVSKLLQSIPTINVILARKKAYIFSTAFVALGVIALVVQGGFNLGVDFTGGRSFVVHFDTPVVANEIAQTLKPAFENAGTEVKTYNGNNQVKITTSYLMEDDSEEADKKVEAALLKGLDKYKSSNPEVVSTSKIGSTVADDIRQTAQVSVIISLIGIFLYILVRFRRWQYGAGAVISLVHNALIVFSGFAVANLLGIPFEIDQVFVAAMLTVIGYTINDTVVVFDRIREFENNYTKENFATSLNDAINATLARCIITSLTTLVVVLALLLLGGDALRGFAFALFIGIIFGTYASLFIASPIVYELSKKEKDTAVTA